MVLGVLDQTRNVTFTSPIPFIDKATFGQDVIIKYHNTHIWALNNPHAHREKRHQSVNVWADILGDAYLAHVSA